MRPNFRDTLCGRNTVVADPIGNISQIYSAHSQVNSGMKKTEGPGLLLVGVGSMMTSMIAAGFILGYFTDSWLNTQPIFLISFGALGFIGAFLKVYRLLSDPELN